MTGLDARPVRRETRAIDTTKGGRRPLVIMLEVGGKFVRIKPKGTRTWFTVDYESIYRLGLHNKFQEIKAAKKARKEARK